MAGQNEGESENEESNQSVARLVYRAVYKTCGMLPVYAREGWHRYLADNVDYLVLPNLKKQDDLTNPRWGVESAVRRVVPDAVDDAANLVPISEEDDSWDSEDAIGMYEAERVGMKRRLH